MKKIKLENLGKIELDTCERLDLFREGVLCKEKIPFYSDGWKNYKSMWDYRWEKNHSNEFCKSLLWLKKPIEICKKVGSFGRRVIDAKLVLDILNKHKDYKTTFVIKGDDSEDSLTLNIYIHRTENNEEFKARKEWQENFITKILLERKKNIEESKLEEEKKEKELLKKLKSKYS